jgi:hypothetical protein
MAIGAIHLAWMRRLAEPNCFQNLHSVIDLGPQDIQLDRPVLARAVCSFASHKKHSTSC